MKFVGNLYSLSPAASVEIFDDDFNFRQMFINRCFQIAETNRLKPDISVVEVLHRRLDEENFHDSLIAYA